MLGAVFARSGECQKLSPKKKSKRKNLFGTFNRSMGGKGVKKIIARGEKAAAQNAAYTKGGGK